MLSQYLQYTLIPVVIVILWAIIVKIRQKDWANTFFLSFAGFTLVVNGIAVYHMMQNVEVPIWMLIAQVVCSSTVVPQAYHYFCRQMGTVGSKGVKIAHWALLIFLLIPSLSIDIHPFKEPMICEPLKFMYFNIFNHGQLIYAITIPSVLILLQAVITIVRIPVVAKTMKMYELRVTNSSKLFVLWWILAVSFCVVSSLVEMDTLRGPIASWIYFITYALLIIGIYGLVAMGLDMRPVVSDDDVEVESIDAFIEANKELAARARRLFMEERLYLRQGIVIDDLVTMLGTNRTYFTRMMRAEFGMSFNEFVTSERIAYSKHLLSATDKTLEEIAMDSGFANASSYCRVFKRLTTTTPDAWRKEHKVAATKFTDGYVDHFKDEI